MSKRLLSLFLVLVAVIGLCACGSGDGDVLIMPISNDPLCLDPQVADSTEAKLLIANCFEGLVRLDKDNKTRPRRRRKLGCFFRRTYIHLSPQKGYSLEAPQLL